MAARTTVMRLASLYATVERMRLAELRVAESDLDDVACAAAIARTIRESYCAGSRDSLSSGRRDEWQIAETARAATEVQIERLATLQNMREDVRDQATVQYRRSRTQTEQMESVVERAQASANLEETRRLQAESDDRFASRQAWLRMKRR